MKKKHKVWILAGSIALVMLMLCFTHKHKETENWTANLEKHWQKCEKCKLKFNRGKHALDEDNYCEECNLTITDNGNGKYGIICYDEYGAVKRQVEYDADGNETSVLNQESEYYKDGVPKHTKKYQDGVLVYEAKYLPCENEDDDIVYMSEEILYSENGEKNVCLYNERSMLISYTVYNAAGAIEMLEAYEYAYNDAGDLIQQITRVNNVLYNEKNYTLDADGHSYVSHEIYYDGIGEVAQEIKYDADGNIMK